jgi:hypothetical protein
MANMAGFDATKHEPMGDFTPMPDGDYRAIATDSEFKQTKAGTGEYLQITWELLDDPYKKRRIWSRLNLNNPNITAVEIAQRELSSICRAVGILQPRDSSELHGKPLILKIGTEKRKDTGEVTNRIKGYKPIDATAPGGAPTPSVTPPPGIPPWRK